MSAAIKTLTFLERQQDIPACDSVIIFFSFGEVRSQYLPNSEVQLASGSWQYQFYVHEEDLAAGMTMADFANCNVVLPYFECLQIEGEPADPEECPARHLNCFTDLEIIEGIPEGAYFGVFEFDEVCESFCMKMYPLDDFFPEATPERDALDYEVFSPSEALQTAMETYVTHWPRAFAPVGGIRVSVAQYGVGALTVNFTVNGVNLTTVPVVIPAATRTLVIAPAALNVLFQSGNSIAEGAEVLAEVVSVSYDEYGTNWEGLRLALLGRFTA